MSGEAPRLRVVNKTDTCSYCSMDTLKAEWRLVSVAQGCLSVPGVIKAGIQGYGQDTSKFSWIHCSHTRSFPRQRMLTEGQECSYKNQDKDGAVLAHRR